MLKTIPELITDVKKTVTLITAEQGKALVTNEGAVLIDVREPQEFSQQASAAAINIPRGLLEMKTLALYPNAEQCLLIHCATGARACLGAEQLQRVGYKNVKVVTCSVDNICSKIV